MAGTEPIAPSAADFDACLAEPARRVETVCGLMEYGERGEGPALVSVHGSPGDYVQGLLMAEYFRVNGFRVIALSRPGYGDTPLDTGRTSAEQADAIVALLDALALDRVAVLGVSGGGPASYALAGHHPDRVRCLVEVDSLCLPMPPNRLERLVLSSRSLVALQLRLIDHFPGLMLTLLGSTGNPSPQETADRVALLRAIVQSLSDWTRMRVGYDNDEAEFAALGELPFAQIACPTLIVHGEADRSVPTAHAERAHAAISGSQMRLLPDGSHVAFFVHPDAQHEALAWLRQHGVTLPM
jgi:pimeloyl-ACP methyl ester carboxylesterase